MTKGKFLTADYHTGHWFEPGNWQELILVGTAVQADIFITLALAPLTAKELAARLGLDERAVNMFFRALAAAGYLNRRDSRFELSPPAKDRFGDKKSPGYLGWAALHSLRLIQRWLTLPEVLKSGRPVPGDRFTEGVEGFIRAMDVYAGPTAEEVAGLCLARRRGAASVLDIGGATGTVSKIFAARGLDVTLFDIPATIDTIRDEMSAHPEIKLTGGDFNKTVPSGPFDIAFLGNVTHIYGPDKNLALFKRVYGELTTGGLIAILDYVRGRSPSAPFFGINMLVNTTGGGVWTEDQYENWLTDAGFSTPEHIDLKARDQQLVVAVKN